jgi:hypothetical protein
LITAHILFLLFRRKDYVLYRLQTKTTCLTGYETNLRSVDHVYIQSEKSVIGCMHYFPNVTKLNFENRFSTTRDSIPIILSRIIPLKQLTKLGIECNHFSFIKMIQLLSFTPNIHTLTITSMPLYKNDYLSIQENETFRLVSNTNTIKDVTFKEKCTSEKLKLLVALCPRVQHLTINIFLKDMESIARFLLEKNNQNTAHLLLLCFSRASTNYFQNLEALIKSGTLASGSMLKLVDSKLYLWR